MRTHRHVGRKLSGGCGLHVYDSRGNKYCANWIVWGTGTWRSSLAVWDWRQHIKTNKAVTTIGRGLAAESEHRPNTLPRSHVRAEVRTSCPHTPPGGRQSGSLNMLRWRDAGRGGRHIHELILIESFRPNIQPRPHIHNPHAAGPQPPTPPPLQRDNTTSIVTSSDASPAPRRAASEPWRSCPALLLPRPAPSLSLMPPFTPKTPPKQTPPPPPPPHLLRPPDLRPLAPCSP